MWFKLIKNITLHHHNCELNITRNATLGIFTETESTNYATNYAAINHYSSYGTW